MKWKEWKKNCSTTATDHIDCIAWRFIDCWVLLNTRDVYEKKERKEWRYAIISFKVENFLSLEIAWSQWRLEIIFSINNFLNSELAVPAELLTAFDWVTWNTWNQKKIYGTWLIAFLPNSHTRHIQNNFIVFSARMFFFHSTFLCASSYDSKRCAVHHVLLLHTFRYHSKKTPFFSTAVELKMYEIYKMYETKWRN